MTKIPRTYHLTKMLKSKNLFDWFKHYEFFIEQNTIQNAFYFQNNISKMFNIFETALNTSIK